MSPFCGGLFFSSDVTEDDVGRRPIVDHNSGCEREGIPVCLHGPTRSSPPFDGVQERAEQ